MLVRMGKPVSKVDGDLLQEYEQRYIGRDSRVPPKLVTSVVI